jgi:O-antigen/teichoic acid export membrane protein
MNRISTNVFSNWGLMGIQFVVSMIMAPMYVRYLQLDLLGTMHLIGGITTQFILLDLGFGTSLTRFVADEKAKDNISGVWTILFTGLSIYGVIAILTLLFGGVTYYFIEDVLKIPVEFTDAAKSYYILSIITLALGFVLFPFLGVLGGFQLYMEQNIVKVVRVVLTGIVTYVLLVRGYGIVAIGVLNLTAQIIVIPIFAYMTYRMLRHSKIKSYFNKSLLKDLSHYSMYVFFAVIAQRLFDHFDSILIGVYISTAAVPVFYYGFQILFSIRRFTAAISQVLLPVVTEYNARSAKDDIFRLFVFGGKVVVFISLPVIVTLFVVGKDFYLLWLGTEFSKSYVIFVLLAVPNIFLFSQRVGIPILYGTGNHKQWSLFQLGNAVLKIGLSIWFVKIFKEPLYGIAWGTTIPSVLYFVYLQYYFRKHLQFDMTVFYKKVYVTYIIPISGLVGILILMKLTFGTLTWITLAITVAAAIPFFLISAYWFVFEPAERKKIISQVPLLNRII